MNDDLVYTIEFLSKKKSVVVEDIDGFYSSIESHKKNINKMEARIPILKDQIIALDKAIKILKSVGDKK